MYHSLHNSTDPWKSIITTALLVLSLKVPGELFNTPEGKLDCKGLQNAISAFVTTGRYHVLPLEDMISALPCRGTVSAPGGHSHT